MTQTILYKQLANNLSIYLGNSYSTTSM